MQKNFSSPHFYQFPISWNSQYTCLFLAFGSCCILIPIPSVLLSFPFSLWTFWKQGRCCICLSLSQPSSLDGGSSEYRLSEWKKWMLLSSADTFPANHLMLSPCQATQAFIVAITTDCHLHPLLYLDLLRTFCSVTSPSYLSLYFSSNHIFRNTSVPWSQRLGLWNLPSPILEINF